MKLDLIYCARVGALLALLVGVLSLTGCAGLNVSWAAVITYNAPHSVPGAPVPAEVPAEEKK